MIADDNGEAVAEFIRTKGITRCPTACVLPTQALVGAADRAALQAYAVVSDRVRQARGANSWGKFLISKPNRSICPPVFPKPGRSDFQRARNQRPGLAWKDRDPLAIRSRAKSRHL